MTNHLTSTTISRIGLGLDEYGYYATDAVAREKVLESVVENIHASTDYQFAESGMLPVRTVASLIFGVWEYKDRDYMDEMGSKNEMMEAVKATIEKAEAAS